MIIFGALLSIILFSLILSWWEMVCLLLLITFFILNSVHLLSFYSSLSYRFGGDIISFLLIILSFWILILMLISRYSVFNSRSNHVEFIYVCMILLLFLVLTFSTTNLFLFYLFFEVSLIPTLILILGWGYQPERLYAGYYLLFYTLFASLPILVSIFYIRRSFFTINFDLISFNINFYLYIAFTLAFLIKMPVFFFHFWLPKAHVEAPVSGSIILAGVLLKLGGYGLIRVIKFFSGPFIQFNLFWISVSLLGMVLVGLVCLSQFDIKSLIAYSSVGHIGLVICGIFTLNYWGFYGSLSIIIAHGLCSSGLFSLANMVYERSGRRRFLINKGLLIFIPSISLFWFMFRVDNIAAPPSLNLVGEILLINSVAGWSCWGMIYVALASFFSCCYRIYMYRITQHGSLHSGISRSSSGVVREFLLLVIHLLPLNLLFLNSGLVTLFICLNSLIKNTNLWCWGYIYILNFV